MVKHLFYDPRFSEAIFLSAVLLGTVLLSRPAAADGWHNPVLELGSVDDWLREAKTAVPDLNQQLGISSLRAGSGIDALKKLAAGRRDDKLAKASNTKPAEPMRGGKLRANLTEAQQQLLARRANDCLQVLAFMKSGNIHPREFPKFPIAKMPEYRLTAKRLLDLMGTAGKEAVLGTLTNHLMAGFRSASDVQFHPDYVNDLLEVLGHSASQGTLTLAELDNLERAMQGSKPPAVQNLVVAINKKLSETLALQTLAERVAATRNSARKTQFLAQLRKRVASASAGELQEVLSSDSLDERTAAAIVQLLKKSIPETGITGLLKLLLVEQADLRQAVDAELRSRQPTYRDMKGELLEIWQLADSPNQRVATYARYFTATAFDDAPVAHCLYWLGQGDDRLSAVIWKRLDVRLSKADAEQKAALARTVFKAWEAKDLSIQNRQDCLELLGRIKHRASARQLVELLLPMARELWPSAGKSLASITGEDYGPMPGDGVAEVTVVVRRWREWLKRHDL